ncbi:MAG: tetraacyldisaccharide 4'-kinase [Kiritimatiellae bacterium]|nr:tetraacyldisaccharide 4'-kinase [Kiritimatiellia bacterium]MCO6400548.1 tetraacyldisaccharide 4'-kinase [Verrucomicrobiota bacterium]
MASRSLLERFEAQLLNVIEDRTPGLRAELLRGILRSLSWIFRGAVQFRLALYDFGIFRPHALGCQVISIGNLTVGGTGKTPIVEVFARTLQQSGRKVAILSRGYRKKEDPKIVRLWRRLAGTSKEIPPRVVSDGTSLLLDSSLGGDEPFMLAKNLPNVAVIVDGNRVKSGKYAVQKLGCDTLILDDGFQYLHLKHRLDIVLVDRTNPFGNGRLLPRGILREPIRNLKRASFIFITKSNGDGAVELKKTLRKYNSTAEISECRHSAKYIQDVYTKERAPLDFIKGLPVAAISGIASPKGFEEELIRLGAIVKYHKRNPDHYRYTQQEIIDVINKGVQRGAKIIVTTEKDAVRFPMLERRDLPVYFLRVEIEMLSGAEEFRAWINRICFKT